MHPDLPIPLPFGLEIKTYGFCVMLGFLSATWFTMRRAQRVKADPDVVLNLAILALIFGIAGARAFFVIHYWHPQFALAPNKLLEIVDIRGGGLEFLGGVIGAMLAILIYLRLRPVSLRLYVDLFAPSLMWGLALGRIGCFFNGCCFGGVCVDPHAAVEPAPAVPWAIRFPYGSPVHVRQWEDRLVSIPAELLVDTGAGVQMVPAGALSMSPEKRQRPLRALQAARDAYSDAQARNADAEELAQLKQALEAASKRAQAHLSANGQALALLEKARQYPSRSHPERQTSVTELEELAAACRSLPVHPTQLYASINAFLLYFLLTSLFYVRKRHGIVFAALLILYPITRAILEIIRVDNPHDVAGLTISQFVSVLLFITGVVWMFVTYKFLPERSPLAVPYIPPAEDERK